MHPHVPSIHMAKRAFIDRFGTEKALLQRVLQLIGGNTTYLAERWAYDNQVRK